MGLKCERSNDLNITWRHAWEQLRQFKQPLIRNTNGTIRALTATVPGFEHFMISNQRRGITYVVFRGKRNIDIDDLVSCYRRHYPDCPGNHW